VGLVGRLGMRGWPRPTPGFGNISILQDPAPSGKGRGWHGYFMHTGPSITIPSHETSQEEN
jgi:hypothetical protein